MPVLHALSSRTVRVFSAVAAAAAVVCGLPEPSVAQNPSADTPVELQETGTFGMGARPLGMGRAYRAVGEDVTTIAYNPAGLAQIRQIEFSVGLAHDSQDRLLSRSGSFTTERTNTRLEHLALAYPYPAYRGSLVLAFAFHRRSDLDLDLFMRGVVEPPMLNPFDPRERFGVVEFEDIVQEGMINAWTGAVAWDFAPNLAFGASVSLLTGSRSETITLARGIPDPSAGDCPDQTPDENGLYYGCGGDFESDLFKSLVLRDADLTGFTGSVGVLARLEGGFRLAGAVELPRWLEYDGSEFVRTEDFIDIVESDILFQDDVTLPLTLSGGASWSRRGLLLAADAVWTDWKQIDFEGDIRAPDRSFAYRSTVSFNLGAEVQIPDQPLRVRGGFFREPIPYELIAADMQVGLLPGDDGVIGTNDDIPVVERFYPEAAIASDRKFFTLGAGVLIQSGLAIDVAYQHGSWERTTAAGYEPPGGAATREEVTENRMFLTATAHFE